MRARTRTNKNYCHSPFRSQLLKALLYVVEHGCKWRGQPEQFGNWHTIYTRLNRWSKAGVLERVFARLQKEQILANRIEHVCLDSATIKVHPDGTGALKKTGPNPNRREPWQYYRFAYRQRNDVERLSGGSKPFVAFFCRFDELDALFAGFVVLALII